MELTITWFQEQLEVAQPLLTLVLTLTKTRIIDLDHKETTKLDRGSLAEGSREVLEATVEEDTQHTKVH